MMTHPGDTAHPFTGSAALLAAALDAAANGWSVLPCHPRGPRAKAPVAQLVPHGHLDASDDPATITAWWTAWPAALIGAAVPASLVVLDVDPRNGGSRPALEAALGPLPATLRVLSGRGDGGAHLYYRRPAGALSAAGLPAGVDLKAAGYCILPPSPHPATGRPYVWRPAPVARLPIPAVLALRPPPSHPPRPVSLAGERGSAAGLVRTVASAPQGRRNGALFWAACRAVEGGHGPGVLAQLAAAAHSVGLGRREVAATIASATHGGRR